MKVLLKCKVCGKENIVLLPLQDHEVPFCCTYPKGYSFVKFVDKRIKVWKEERKERMGKNYVEPSKGRIIIN